MMVTDVMLLPAETEWPFRWTADKKVLKFQDNEMKQDVRVWWLGSELENSMMTSGTKWVCLWF